MRIYWGRLLKRVRYSPKYHEHPVEFNVHLGAKTDKDELRMFGDAPVGRLPRHKWYRAPTLEGLYQLLKDDGHQIWGYDDILDFACLPHNAFEYVLIRDELKRRGNTDKEIEKMFSLG